MTIFAPVGNLSLRVSLFLLVIVSHAAGQVCSHPDDLRFYFQNNYKVREVRIESPFDFFHGVSKSLNEVKGKLPLQPGSNFSLDKANEGRDLIRQELKGDDKNPSQSLLLNIVIVQVANCTEGATPHELDLVYKVITTNYNAYLNNTFELEQAEIERPATTAATSAETTSPQSFFLIKPNVGYNGTRRLFGGMNMTAKMPGGIFDNLSLSTSGSTSSNVEEIEMVKTLEPVNSIFSRFDYRFGYKHSDIPSGTNRLKEGKFQAQFFGATKPLGNSSIVARFGASLEGGNQQTDLDPALVSGNNLANSGYGSLKVYVGATKSSQRYSLTGSYGLQAGTDGASTSVDFVKQVIDLGLTGQFGLKEGAPGAVHKSFNVEAQVAGGTINTRGMLPVAERFFGGNATSDFISNDTWGIRSGPFIRSIPQNRLNSEGTIGPIGGTSFYSVNLTVSRPVWGRPLIPKEVIADPQFLRLFNAQRNTAREALINSFKNNVPAFQDFIRNLDTIKTDVEQAEPLLATLPQDIPEDSDLGLAIQDVRDDITITKDFFSKDKSDLPSRLGNFIKSNVSIIAHFIGHLRDLGDALEAASLPVPAQQARALAGTLANKRTSLVAQLDNIDDSEATRQADEVMNDINPVLDAFIKELNLYSISPVAVFDAARIWPDRFGTRYGIGGGIRLSLVNFNVTLGYAVNPHPRFQEGRGAFFFSMDVTDLFR